MFNTNLPRISFGGGTGSFIMCDEKDDSWFCNLSKTVSVIQMIIFLIVIALFIYYIVNTVVLKNESFSFLN